MTVFHQELAAVMLIQAHIQNYEKENCRDVVQSRLATFSTGIEVGSFGIASALNFKVLQLFNRLTYNYFMV
jgi:hypothetical protein